MSAKPMMKCGHAANSKRKVDDEWVDACIICAGIDPRGNEIDDSPPSLEGRTARCGYYGKACPMWFRNRGSCKTRTREDQTCRCEAPSSPDLWFFERKDGEKFDRFYCSCYGDD